MKKRAVSVLCLFLCLSTVHVNAGWGDGFSTEFWGKLLRIIQWLKRDKGQEREKRKNSEMFSEAEKKTDSEEELGDGEGKEPDELRNDNEEEFDDRDFDVSGFDGDKTEICNFCLNVRYEKCIAMMRQQLLAGKTTCQDCDNDFVDEMLRTDNVNLLERIFKGLDPLLQKESVEQLIMQRMKSMKDIPVNISLMLMPLDDNTN